MQSVGDRREITGRKVGREAKGEAITVFMNACRKTEAMSVCGIGLGAELHVSVRILQSS